MFFAQFNLEMYTPVFFQDLAVLSEAERRDLKSLFDGFVRLATGTNPSYTKIPLDGQE